VSTRFVDAALSFPTLRSARHLPRVTDSDLIANDGIKPVDKLAFFKAQDVSDEEAEGGAKAGAGYGSHLPGAGDGSDQDDSGSDTGRRRKAMRKAAKPAKVHTFFGIPKVRVPACCDPLYSAASRTCAVAANAAGGWQGAQQVRRQVQRRGDSGPRVHPWHRRRRRRCARRVCEEVVGCRGEGKQGTSARRAFFVSLPLLPL
jgi:hypothetical protein